MSDAGLWAPYNPWPTKTSKHATVDTGGQSRCGTRQASEQGLSPAVTGANTKSGPAVREHDEAGHLRPLEPEGSTPMIQHDPDPGNTPAGDIRDAAWSAVVIAATHWHQSAAALQHILARAHVYGLSKDDLRAATGLDPVAIERMIDGADV